MNATEVCVNISIIYFLLVINTIIYIYIYTARKQQLQSMHFNEEHFSSSESSIDEVVITISQVIRKQENKLKELKRSTVRAAATEYFQWGKR